MGEVKVWSHNVSLTFYRLTSLSFHVYQPPHSWNTAFSKFDLENPRSRSWVRGMLKVTTWVQHSIDSHPFHSMSIGHPIPEIQLFQNLTLKIQGQCHVWGQSWKSQSGCNILSTHIPFVPCQSALPFLRYSIFKIWPWKSKVKVMGEGKVESHNMGATFCRLTSLSFHVNWPSHSWDTTFSKFDLKIQGQGYGWGQSCKSKSGYNILSTHIPFIPCQSALPFLKQHFQNWNLKIQGQGQMAMMLHKYRSRQFHRTSNGINPSSDFRDIGSAKSGPSAAWFDKFFAHGQTHMGQMGKWPWQCTTTGLDNSTEFRMVKIRQAVTEIWVPQVWQPPTRPTTRTVTTIPLQPGGLRGKKVWQAQTDRQTDGLTERNRQKDRQSFFIKENPFENVICKMLAILGLNSGLFDAYFSSRCIINQSYKEK